jgi:hypothetical protein
MLTPYELLRIVLDPLRLTVLGRAAEGPLELGKLAFALGVPERRVRQAVGRLREAGLLDADLKLNVDALRAIADALPTAEPPAAELLEGNWTPEEAQVLATFFRGRTLTQIPAQHSKRLVILERLSQEFEPGIRYEEFQVNVIIKTFHEDTASLRRYMVDAGFLTREAGVYWRTGGRV